MSSRHAPPGRAIVIGTTGSGKSTLARQIARVLGSPYIELDALHWEANWTEAEDAVFQQRVAAAIAPERWVVDGNYSGKLGTTVYEAADTVVWLDYPFRIVFSRLFARTMRRTLRREELWNGNRESLRNHFMSRDSLFLWAVKTHWKHRRTYPERFARPELDHLTVVRLRRPNDAERLVARLARETRIARPA